MAFVYDFLVTHHPVRTSLDSRLHLTLLLLNKREVLAQQPVLHFVWSILMLALTFCVLSQVRLPAQTAAEELLLRHAPQPISQESSRRSVSSKSSNQFTRE